MTTLYRVFRDYDSIFFFSSWVEICHCIVRTTDTKTYMYIHKNLTYNNKCSSDEPGSVTSRSFRKLGQTDQPTTGRRTDRVIRKLQAKNLHTYIPFFLFVIIFKVELIGIYICMNTSKSAIKLYSIHRLLEINNNDNNGKKREGGGGSTHQTYV